MTVTGAVLKARLQSLRIDKMLRVREIKIISPFYFGGNFGYSYKLCKYNVLPTTKGWVYPS